MASMYLVIVPNYWGKGRTALDAANVARAQAGKRKGKSLPKPRIVYSFDPAKTPKVYVDDMGSLCWNGERPATVEKVGV